MTRIDFYLLKENALQARNQWTCRIIDKAYQQGHHAYVQVNTLAEAQQLDDLLWTFRESSFIPHNLYGEPSELIPPIQIGIEAPPLYHKDILINLTDRLAEHYQKFQRVIEIIPNRSEWRNEARNSYRKYREAGCDLKLHDLSH